jgi:hypothetical protein
MTPAEALRELLARLGANNGAAVLVSEEELKRWPEAAVHAMKTAGLLAPATPAANVVCPGCEQQCSMPVETVPSDGDTARSFIVCDKRDDISRVPVSDAKLRQWSASSATLAKLVAGLLGTTCTDAVTAERSELGVLKGRKHSSHVVLVADSSLRLHVAGHAAVLADILTFEGDSLRLDKQAIVRLVDKPVAGAGDKESAHQRRERLKRLVQTEKARGNSAFLKTIAEKEGISVSRLKQILQDPSRKSQSAQYSRY